MEYSTVWLLNSAKNCREIGFLWVDSGLVMESFTDGKCAMDHCEHIKRHKHNKIIFLDIGHHDFLGERENELFGKEK